MDTGRRKASRSGGGRDGRTAPQPLAGERPSGYGRFLEGLKERIRAAQVKAALSVNRELIAL
jgi:hypothetical protein